MMIYWIVVLVPLIVSLAEIPNEERASFRALPALLVLFLFFFMGFRETCGDFPTYVRLYELVQNGIVQGKPFLELVRTTEPIYGFFNWISAELGWGIIGVNIFCAIVFLGCLARFAYYEPNPLFFLAISIPYFVIVVGMGYTRQGVAAGLILLSIQSLRFGKPWQFFLQIILATGFHVSAAVALPAVLFAKLPYNNDATRNIVRVLILAVGTYGAYRILSERYSEYVTFYIESDRYSSGGAVLRSVVTFSAAIIFFIKRRDWREKFEDEGSLIFFGLCSLAVLPLAFVASTPADRMGLYLIPFQLIVFSRIPTLQNSPNLFNQYKFGIAACYVAYFFVWLHLGSFAKQLWVPYETALW